MMRLDSTALAMLAPARVIIIQNFARAGYLFSDKNELLLDCGCSRLVIGACGWVGNYCGCGTFGSTSSDRSGSSGLRERVAGLEWSADGPGGLDYFRHG